MTWKLVCLSAAMQARLCGGNIGSRKMFPKTLIALVSRQPFKLKLSRPNSKAVHNSIVGQMLASCAVRKKGLSPLVRQWVS